MTPWDRIWHGAAWGAGLGAAAISLLALLWWMVFAPDGLKDGQFVLLFYLFTIPFGALLGVVAGVARALLGLHARDTAGWVCVGGGGLIAVMAVLYTVMMLGREKSLVLAHPAYGAPLIWAGVEMLYGLVLLGRG